MVAQMLQWRVVLAAWPRNHCLQLYFIFNLEQVLP
uniref:Uncharacterized protein n=1 Tax=Anguilla anguilla TaxID=7936 RepID=A0A0E9UMZ6_ANGAN